jgi:hypothetical protein
MPSLPPILSLLVVLAATTAPTAKQLDLLRRSDIGSFAPSSFRARLRLEVPKGVHQVEIWRSGEGKTLIRFLDPSEHGKYMVLLGRELWLIAPGARKPVQLRPSHRLYGGATIDEVLGLRLTEHYDVESVAVDAEVEGGLTTYELRAKTADVLFPSAQYVVRTSTARPASAVFRLGNGKPATAVDFVTWNERPVYARRVVFHDLVRKGVRGAVEVVELEERSVPEGLFDLADPKARRALEESSEAPKNP